MLSNFISEVKNRGLAKTNRFEVQIPVPSAFPRSQNYREFVNPTNSSLVSLFCEVSNLPPINVAVKPLKIFGPSYQRPYTSEYGGDGINMTFHVDSDMNVKRFFEDWMEVIVSGNDFTVAYERDYTTDIYLRQLNEIDEVT